MSPGARWEALAYTPLRQIILILLSIGEVYLVDLRKEHRGRFELVEDAEDDEQYSRSR